MATSKTVSSVSNSNKQDSNKESVSYLVFYCNDANQKHLDGETYLVCNSLEEIPKQLNSEWDRTVDDEEILVLPFYNSQLKRIKQTLELVGT